MVLRSSCRRRGRTTRSRRPQIHICKSSTDFDTSPNVTGALVQLGITQKSAVGTKAPKFDGTQPCASPGVDPELFFPETPEDIYHNTRKAKAICNTCVFVEDCLEYALDNDVVGIWGATTPTERKNIRRSRRLPPPKSTAKMLDRLTR